MSVKIERGHGGNARYDETFKKIIHPKATSYNFSVIHIGRQIENNFVINIMLPHKRT